MQVGKRCGTGSDYKSLGDGVIVLDADNKLLHAWVIIFSRHSIFRGLVKEAYLVIIMG